MYIFITYWWVTRSRHVLHTFAPISKGLQPILLPFCTVTQLHRMPPSTSVALFSRATPSTLNFYPHSLLLLRKHCDCLRERCLPTTHLTGTTAHKRWRGRARSCALREGMQVSNLRYKWQRPTLLQLSTEALVPKLKNQTMYKRK